MFKHQAHKVTVGIFVERQHAGYFGKASWRRRHPPAVVHHGWQGMFEWRVVYFDFGLHSCQAGRAAGPRRPGGVGVWAATSSHAGLLQARLHPPAGRRRRGARAHSDGLWSSALCHVPRGLPAVHPTPPQLCNDTFRDPPTCERALSDACAPRRCHVDSLLGASDAEAGTTCGGPLHAVLA